MGCLLRFEVPRFAMYSSTRRLVFLIMIGNNLTFHELWQAYSSLEKMSIHPYVVI